MPRQWLLFLTVGLVALPAALMSAEPNYFTYHPMSIMSLGLGYSPNDLSQAKLRAIEYTVNSAEEGALDTFFATVLVRNSTQLKEALNLDVRVDASFLFFKGGATFTYDQSSLFTRDSVSVVLRAVSEYGRLTMRNPVLSKEAKALLSAGKMADFEQTFGSRYVVMERRGASVAVILTITDVSAGDKNKLGAGLEASGGWGPLGGNAKATFQKLLERSSESGNLNVQVVATGGEGFGGLADLVKALSTKADGLKNIQEALGVYLKQFNAKNSVPIGFHTSSMRDFGWKPAREMADTWSAENERRLIQIVDSYRLTKIKIDSIRGLIGNEDGRAILLNPEKVTKLKDAIPVYENYLDELAALHKTLRQQGKKTAAVPPDPLPKLEIVPPLPPLPKGSFRIELGKHRWDPELSFRYLIETLSNIQNLARKENIDPASLKDVRRVFLIEGKFLERVELFFDKEKLAAFPVKDKATDTEVAIPLSDLKLRERVNQLATARPQGEGRFVINVQDRFGRMVTFPIAEARWKHVRTSFPFKDISIRYIGSALK